jgi:CheY-like chemotaxis protein
VRAADSTVTDGKPHPRILVAEGYEPLRQTLRRMLQSRRYQVLLASGSDAFRLWHERRADLLILDLHMPGVDGLEGLLAFRAAVPERPIIVISAGDRSRGFEVLEDALRLGATAALAKPFRLLQLLDVVAQVLGMEPVDPG